MFVTAQWTDSRRVSIRVTDEAGAVHFVPPDQLNLDYQLITEGDDAKDVDPVVIADPT